MITYHSSRELVGSYTFSGFQTVCAAVQDCGAGSSSRRQIVCNAPLYNPGQVEACKRKAERCSVEVPRIVRCKEGETCLPGVCRQDDPTWMVCYRVCCTKPGPTPSPSPSSKPPPVLV
ncbi:predicted protein [Plenodomus lingam JN3]|uniref:Predicted protein n=1 Tax=Leptosphaeria maculans (strain JN3 / isolate v23.1.3 / race Av1-4-5-6-7-8) TaxID=985895 RepID=E5A3Y5_LEPMJ|nr:predicted protein [Plenodomus lingam JN3]CBX98330.1 predicted protein [Plenodomus lingam JN3]